MGAERRDVVVCPPVRADHAGRPEFYQCRGCVYFRYVAVASAALTYRLLTRVLVPGTNPDFATQDLYDSIQNGTFPGWTMFAQVLSPEAAQSFKYNVLDLTKYVYSKIFLYSRC